LLEKRERLFQRVGSTLGEPVVQRSARLILGEF
jgi:hypothetical protein